MALPSLSGLQAGISACGAPQVAYPALQRLLAQYSSSTTGAFTPGASAPEAAPE